jgi:hypothetical protein
MSSRVGGVYQERTDLSFRETLLRHALDPRSGGYAHVDDGCDVGARRSGHFLTQAKCLEMARDLYLFPRRQRGIENGIHRKMLLAPGKPRRCVIKPHDGE